MGVMPCSRKNCDNILCHSYIEDMGYLCDDCIRKLRDKIGDLKTTKAEMRSLINDFISSDKEEDYDNEVTLDDMIQ